MHKGQQLCTLIRLEHFCPPGPLTHESMIIGRCTGVCARWRLLAIAPMKFHFSVKPLALRHQIIIDDMWATGDFDTLVNDDGSYVGPYWNRSRPKLVKFGQWDKATDTAFRKPNLARTPCNQLTVEITSTLTFVLSKAYGCCSCPGEELITRGVSTKVGYLSQVNKAYRRSPAGTCR